jgi:hypothetical protein
MRVNVMQVGGGGGGMQGFQVFRSVALTLREIHWRLALALTRRLALALTLREIHRLRERARRRRRRRRAAAAAGPSLALALALALALSWRLAPLREIEGAAAATGPPPPLTPAVVQGWSACRAPTVDYVYGLPQSVEVSGRSYMYTVVKIS